MSRVPVREWFVDWAGSAFAAVVVGVLVAFAGGPHWASVGFAWVVYLEGVWRPRR